MKSIVQRFEGDEDSLLLMYLADELPQAQREAVQRRLEQDEALRRRLQRVQGLQEQVMAALGRLDEATPAPVSEAAAVRQVARAMRQVQTARRAVPALGAGRNLALPWWAYPLSAAAAVLLAFIVWWGQQAGPPGLPSQFAGEAQLRQQLQEMARLEEQRAADRLQHSFDAFDELARHESLLDAENQLYALWDAAEQPAETLLMDFAQ